jgi:hypothetical protein
MGLILELEESEFSGYINDGTTYAATLVEEPKLKEKPFTDKDTGEKVKKFEFHFKLISDDGHDGQDIWGETSTRFNTHPECRLKNWSEALLGQRLPAKYKLDLDTLRDHKCIVVVGRRDYEKDGQAKSRNFVADVQPTRAAAMAMAQEDEPF